MPPAPALEPSARQAVRLPLDSIEPGHLSMRSAMDDQELNELALSFSRIGQHTPCSVIQSGDHYELIFGHRRCAAATILGWTHIDAYIEHRDDPALWALAWSENHNRSGISPSDQAHWLDRMRSANGWTQAQLSAVTGMSETQISDLLAILLYPEPLREALDAGAISHGVARSLNRIDDPATQMLYLEQAALYGCTARTAEEWVRTWRLSLLPPPEPNSNPDIEHQPEQLPAQLALTCAACHTTHHRHMAHVILCADCRELVTNPPMA